jgi:hypothetical protein
MRYRVLKQFKNIDGSFLRPNDSIECTTERARILINNGIIGGIIETVAVSLPVRNPVQREIAIERPHKRKYRKRLK